MKRFEMKNCHDDDCLMDGDAHNCIRVHIATGRLGETAVAAAATVPAEISDLCRSQGMLSLRSMMGRLMSFFFLFASTSPSSPNNNKNYDSLGESQ